MDLLLGDPALVQSQLLQTAHIAPRGVLDLFNGVPRLDQAVRSARVQPGEILLQRDDLELAPAQVLQVDIGDLQLPRAEGFRPRAISITWWS